MACTLKAWSPADYGITRDYEANFKTEKRCKVQKIRD